MASMILSCFRRLCGRGVKIKKAKGKLEEEWSQGYYPARYSRVRIGDIVGKQYHILGKLGWGQYSTVWFAKNIDKQQWVSIKIHTTTHTKDPANERNVMEELNNGDPDHVGYFHVVHLLTFFVHEEPHGQHGCLVYNAMGEPLSVFQTRFRDGLLPLPLVKRVSRHLLFALSYIHSYGIIHTDIHQRNILCDLDDAVRERYIQSVPSNRDLADIDPDSPIPSTGMTAPEDVLNINFCLADFGQASHHPKRAGDERDGQLQLMQAPEVLLGLPWDTKIDIWNAGCLIWELLENAHFFDGRVDGLGDYKPEEHLREIVHHLGPAPERLVSRQKTKHLGSGGTMIEGLPTSATHWKECEHYLEGNERAQFFDFMESMLAWLPEDRPTASKALEHEWLAN